MNEEHWRFMLADLRAAEWVIKTDPAMDGEILGKKFLAIHQYFLRNIGRERPDLFRNVNREFLVQIVRMWIELYRHTLRALAHQYPRTSETADLRLAKINWSRGLRVSYEGILQGMSYSSRYAEFWAEYSLRDAKCLQSFAARMRFVGTPAYWHLLELGNARELQVVDMLDNSATPFDLIAEVQRNPESSPVETYQRRGWRTIALTSKAKDVIHWYATNGLDAERPSKQAALPRDTRSIFHEPPIAAMK